MCMKDQGTAPSAATHAEKASKIGRGQLPRSCNTHWEQKGQGTSSTAVNAACLQRIQLPKDLGHTIMKLCHWSELTELGPACLDGLC